ncbi:uncharacterized protein LOC111269061 [Varroa jacobsoni]|uniref:Uncharacterized protein n=1 Tax=Varroa destructor TaxID=109461 RepID=A0A7M7JLE1_VARDE|nr:uncharacterized protein LOC111246924 [Varroa destructor]XP_022704147.1 uncharacterized protein LOC111269061 [Varroa jacobsoni]
MKLRRSFLLLLSATLCLVFPVCAGFRLKKLAKAALLGAAIAPRFVPIPIPHHVHKKEHHGWNNHGWDQGWDHGGWNSHGHGPLPITFTKGGWEKHHSVHDASLASHGW